MSSIGAILDQAEFRPDGQDVARLTLRPTGYALAPDAPLCSLHGGRASEPAPPVVYLDLRTWVPVRLPAVAESDHAVHLVRYDRLDGRLYPPGDDGWVHLTLWRPRDLDAGAFPLVAAPPAAARPPALATFERMMHELCELLRVNLQGDDEPVINLHGDAVWLSGHRLHLLNAGAFRPERGQVGVQQRQHAYGKSLWQLARAYFGLFLRDRKLTGSLDEALPRGFWEGEGSFDDFRRALDSTAFRLDVEALEMRLRLLGLSRALQPRLVLPIQMAAPSSLPVPAALDTIIRQGREQTQALEKVFGLDAPLDAPLDDAVAALRRLEQVVPALATQFDLARHRLGALSTYLGLATAEIAQLQQRLERLEGDRGTQQEQVNVLRGQVERIQAQLTQSQTRVGQLEAQLKQTQTTLAGREAELARQVKANETILADLQKARGRIGDLERDLAAATRERDKAKAAIVELQTAGENHVALQRQLTAVTKERDELRQERDRDLLPVTVKEARKRLAELDLELQATRTERDALRGGADRAGLLRIALAVTALLLAMALVGILWLLMGRGTGRASGAVVPCGEMLAGFATSLSRVECHRLGMPATGGACLVLLGALPSPLFRWTTIVEWWALRIGATRCRPGRNAGRG